jgi:HD-GYP domain-containing protein (c-di-GMP phosphodiesterase class II)
MDRKDSQNASSALRWLIDLGIALSAERNADRLLERIVLGAKELTNSDGGTLYLRTNNETLRFVILRNDTLNVAMGGTTGKTITFPELPLYKEGQPNHNNVATYVALNAQTINIEDAYVAENFDFSGTKKFDETTGYRSKSFLTVPLRNHQNEVVGVLQLINAQLPNSKEVTRFRPDQQELVEALASQAAVALTNQQLIAEQRVLFDSFINIMAAAIDAKSAYTGGHCQRVPVLTEMLAEAAMKQTDGPYADFHLTEDQWYELKVAGGLHDVGKVSTPVHVMDKSTKLETIYDRINEVRVRYEVLRRDAEIEYLTGLLAGGDENDLKVRRDAKLIRLDEEVSFLQQVNIGGEFLPDAKIDRIKAIAEQEYVLESGRRRLLDEVEVMNLSIRRGTLNDEERKIINDHIVITIQMLEALPFPRSMKNVPEIAGGHHEKMDGTGYPRGLNKDQLSLPARMMGIADIFEALTAADRPYKKPKTLSESIKIMYFMVKDQHIDGDLFELFLRERIFDQYAERFLLPEQIDPVDVDYFLKQLDNLRNPPPPAPAPAAAQ